MTGTLLTLRSVSHHRALTGFLLFPGGGVWTARSSSPGPEEVSRTRSGRKSASSSRIASRTSRSSSFRSVRIVSSMEIMSLEFFFILRMRSSAARMSFARSAAACARCLARSSSARSWRSAVDVAGARSSRAARSASTRLATASARNARYAHASATSPYSSSGSTATTTTSSRSCVYQPSRLGRCSARMTPSAQSASRVAIASRSCFSRDLEPVMVNVLPALASTTSRGDRGGCCRLLLLLPPSESASASESESSTLLRAALFVFCCCSNRRSRISTTKSPTLACEPRAAMSDVSSTWSPNRAASAVSATNTCSSKVRPLTFASTPAPDSFTPSAWRRSADKSTRSWAFSARVVLRNRASSDASSAGSTTVLSARTAPSSDCATARAVEAGIDVALCSSPSSSLKVAAHRANAPDAPR
mmetsp:Transcript_1650/g.6380  ORF Transcript_1650/g.6380 Transcript_1650/m.6380 type:complete len:418 (-) Transcript_1650:476-1729(-)